MSALTPAELTEHEAIVRRADADVRKCFRYTPDPPRYDQWRDYSDFFIMPFPQALSKNMWAQSKVIGGVGKSLIVMDDCDGMSMTTISLSIKRGLPLNSGHLGVVFGDVEQGNIPKKQAYHDEVNHAIGLAQIGERWLVAGDTFGPAYWLGSQPFANPHKLVYRGDFTNPTTLFKWKD